MCFLGGINAKWFWNIIEEKYFDPLRLLNLSNLFFNPFVDTALIFSDSSFNSFSRSKHFVLFKVTFLFSFFSLTSRFVFFTKLAMSLLLAKLTCTDLAVKFS